MTLKRPSRAHLGVVTQDSAAGNLTDKSLIYGSVQKTADRSVQIVSWFDETASNWAFGVLEHKWDDFLQGTPKSVTLYQCGAYTLRPLAYTAVATWALCRFFSDISRDLLKERTGLEDAVPASELPEILLNNKQPEALPFPLPPLMNRALKVPADVAIEKRTPFKLVIK
ncbi:MAG: hypothetical protein KGQ41_08370 [Alphaproteobacteria bacterium]|nr:hypothetical protein [Alphaproteobacteria bacterium]